MGAQVSVGKSIYVKASPHQAADVINAQNSGTTARLMSSVCALFDGFGVVTGDPSLRRRPMEPLLGALRQLGAHAVSTLGNGCAPCVIGGPMRGGSAELDASLSSQFASSLAIACAVGERDTVIALKGRIQSADYLRMTLEMIDYYGGRVELDGGKLYCYGAGHYRARRITIPGDFSSASFLLAAAAITGGDVSVGGLSNRFTQADARIVELLRSFGCSISWRGSTVYVHPSELRGADVDCTSSPDLFPIISVVAAASKGKSTVKGSENLRYKETDRVETTCLMLRAMGVRCRVSGNTLEIKGGISGGVVDSFGDHRIEMASAVAGLRSRKGVRVKDSGSHSISYPSFVSDMRKIGGRVSR